MPLVLSSLDPLTRGQSLAPGCLFPVGSALRNRTEDPETLNCSSSSSDHLRRSFFIAKRFCFSFCFFFLIFASQIIFTYMIMRLVKEVKIRSGIYFCIFELSIYLRVPFNTNVLTHFSLFIYSAIKPRNKNIFTIWRQGGV